MDGYQSQDQRLGLGIGIAKGVATLGQIGFEGRLDYAAIGTVSNLAARLCDIATDSQILIDKQAAEEIFLDFNLIELKPRNLKGFEQPITYYQIG